MKWGRKRRQQARMAAARAAVPHRCDYRKVGKVTDPDGTEHTIWKCKGCPNRMRD